MQRQSAHHQLEPAVQTGQSGGVADGGGEIAQATCGREPLPMLKQAAWIPNCARIKLL
jgi:hypothetical protein